jgi:hypothetical protein
LAKITLFELNHKLLILRKQFRRKLEEFYIFLTSRTHKIGFVIHGTDPFTIKLRISETKRFWWYNGTPFGSAPLQLTHSAELIYDLTEKRVLKSRALPSLLHSDMIRIFDKAPCIKAPTLQHIKIMIANKRTHCV